MNLNLAKMAREAGFRVGDQFAAGCSEDDLQKLASIITAELKTLETPQRTWVGLTDDEIYDMYNEPRSDAEMVAFARELEAKLKEKNT